MARFAQQCADLSSSLLSFLAGSMIGLALLHGEIFPLKLCRHVLKFLQQQRVSIWPEKSKCTAYSIWQHEKGSFSLSWLKPCHVAGKFAMWLNLSILYLQLYFCCLKFWHRSGEELLLLASKILLSPKFLVCCSMVYTSGTVKPRTCPCYQQTWARYLDQRRSLIDCSGEYNKRTQGNVRPKVGMVHSTWLVARHLCPN